MSDDIVGYRIRHGYRLVHIVKVVRQDHGPVMQRALCGGLEALVLPVSPGNLNPENYLDLPTALGRQFREPGWVACPRCRARA